MQRRRVVVTGLGIISPVGSTVPEAWQNVLAGKSGITRVTRFDPSRLSCQIAGEVKDFDVTQYLSAKEALAGGLVSKVVKPEELLATVHVLAREIADNASPVSLALTRQMMWRMLGADHPMEAHKIDSRAIYARGRQSDAREGVMSFLEKRPANFTDKISKDMPSFYPWWNERKYS